MIFLESGMLNRWFRNVRVHYHDNGYSMDAWCADNASLWKTTYLTDKADSDETDYRLLKICIINLKFYLPIIWASDESTIATQMLLRKLCISILLCDRECFNLWCLTSIFKKWFRRIRACFPFFRWKCFRKFGYKNDDRVLERPCIRNIRHKVHVCDCLLVFWSISPYLIPS